MTRGRFFLVFIGQFNGSNARAWNVRLWQALPILGLSIKSPLAAVIGWGNEGEILNPIYICPIYPDRYANGILAMLLRNPKK